MSIKVLLENKKIILFDGVCNLCNSSVLTIIKHDKKNVFLFAPLQSELGKEITNHFKIDTVLIDSIILVESKNKYSIKSTAALKIIQQFSWPWQIFQICWILPSLLRNSMYTYIAKNRYKWFGKKDACMVPTPEIKSKFI